MCLLFAYINPNPTPGQYKIILANNRDEFYSRPTEKAHLWSGTPSIIAGMDLQPEREGGAWFGVSSEGKISCLLNVFQSKSELEKLGDVAGRGFLVPNFLRQSNQTADSYISHLTNSNITYNKYSLVLFETSKEGRYDGTYFTNVGNKKINLGNGVHGFGNNIYDKPFRKVVSGKEMFSYVIDKHGKKVEQDVLIKSLLTLMYHKNSFYPDETLRMQGEGYSEEMIKGLSSIWVSIPFMKYGTRTTSIVLVDFDDHIVFHESTMTKPSSDCVKFEDSQHELDIFRR